MPNQAAAVVLLLLSSLTTPHTVELLSRILWPSQRCSARQLDGECSTVGALSPPMGSLPHERAQCLGNWTHPQSQPRAGSHKRHHHAKRGCLWNTKGPSSTLHEPQSILITTCNYICYLIKFLFFFFLLDNTFDAQWLCLQALNLSQTPTTATPTNKWSSMLIVVRQRPGGGGRGSNAGRCTQCSRSGARRVCIP